MARITNAEFLKNMLDINESLKAEKKPLILSEKMETKIKDVLTKSENIKADHEMTNLIFNQLFKNQSEIREISEV